ncbi:hypothetical protein AN639_10615 [Candidatus Epulonipiscium fishelsonii]|uniref:Uncharacterized protein n=1 Tax=Candidatus Epulonipiscium fishelsonii TaxID=77094 RepID=A0ACC8XA02_9FIRM|nr:hypothetical protein AN396_09425 [Epulopiscium sp. SCG-B11WGA-EpuloA1]ONI43342.1 hypothetical protein AN639_10615 [Epulopiscium sp. SCG-B05WGA-EpuloA1]
MNTQGNFVTINETEYYKITNSQNLSPFFIQVASSSDIWIFLSSSGGITAGRKNSSNNIFPYTTNDRLNMDYDTGSKTIVKVNNKIWLPFEQFGTTKYDITRNIYKSCYSNSIILEEVNNDLQLSYSCKYETSEKYGIIKTSKIVNLSEEPQNIDILDGLMNLLPYGVNSILQNNSSTLVDAYKASELEDGTLGVYSLTTTINDTPNPIEMLKANIVYNTLPVSNVYLNPDIISRFINNQSLDISKETYGTKCGYFIILNDFKLDSFKEWSFVLDVGYDHSKIAETLNFIKKGDFSSIFEDIKKGTDDIINIVDKADGIQETGDKVACAAHYVNTLYNVMRGGIFENAYSFNYNDFCKFVAIKNNRALEVTNLLKDCKTIMELKEISKQNPVLHRLALEYLPLTFSRRHGDPSRPWNKFNIDIKDEQGNKKISYEGNWRDIFQNWEALGLSYPEYYENMVAKFVNASTIDGYNPYRITTLGIDWEKPDPEDPFSGIGYWGDHQIIYLLRLLEGLNNHFPETLKSLMNKEVFSYANVPYIIKSYDEILKNPKKTIIFDFDKDEIIEKLVTKIGTDAKLLLDSNEEVVTVSLAEKLLVTALCKISNLLVGGGIWMNTERPEWNDANNGIVGIGLSMITVYHLNSYLQFIEKLFKDKEYKISSNVVEWLKATTIALHKYENNYKGHEKALLDELGQIFSDYRRQIYDNGLKPKKALTSKEILEWIETAKKAIEYTINENKGDIFVTYNLINKDFSVTPMRDMLEGQSAIIGSKYLNTNETLKLINNMNKTLYNENIKAHTLYPINMTKRFLSKNQLQINVDEIDGIILKDINGNLHFNSDINTEETLIKKCIEKNISPEITKSLTDEFERIFAHNKFNGRSEVFYKFEGIGCVYWHQNAKFALAVLETVQRAFENGEDITDLYNEYHKILQGFIFRKSPIECNAIPIEPYSHSSFNGKSEQPGMTGQVKESVIMRRGELGVKILNGTISFNPIFLLESEFDCNGEINFTIYGVKVKYIKSQDKNMKILFNDGTVIVSDNFVIDHKLSKNIFERNSNISLIEITY